MLQLNGISPSRIKTYDTCLFKYWLTYHRPDITLKTNWGAVHGSLIHDVLENYVNGNDTDWRRRLYEGYAGTLQTLDRYGRPTVMETPLVWAKPAEFADKRPYCDTCPLAQDGHCKISGEPLDNLSGCPKSLFEGSIAMVEEVIDRYEHIWPNTLREGDEIIGCEYQFRQFPMGVEVPLIGIIDLVVRHGDDTIEIIDYKSGNWTQDEAQCREDIQVKIYSMAARREFIDDINGKGYNFKNVFLTFDYFKGQPISVSFTEEEDAETERYVARKIREIQRTSRITRIVPERVNFADRRHWKCRSLCDTAVCESEWTGAFEV